MLAAANLAALAGVLIIGGTLVNLRDEELPDPEHFAALHLDESVGGVAPLPSATLSPALVGNPTLLPNHREAAVVPVGYVLSESAGTAPENVFALPSRTDRQMRFYLRE